MTPRLIIQQAPCKNISYFHKAILAEIVELHQFGNNGGCFAENEHFAEVLGTTAKTISNAIHEIAQAGWILIAKKRGKRRLVPTERLENLLDGQEVAPIVSQKPKKPAPTNPREVDNCPPTVDCNPSTVDANPREVDFYNKEELTTNLQLPVAAPAAQSRKKSAPRPEKASSEESSAPLVKAYTEWYKSKSGNVAPPFDGRDGKAGKEIYVFLKNQSKTKDSAGAVKGMEYVFDHWHMLDYGIQKQINLWQIKANLSTIMVQIAAGRKNAQQLEAQRAERELAPPVTKSTNPLAIPQHPDAYRLETKPEVAAQWAADEQARRDRIMAQRLAKIAAEEEN